jgi:hypothetical protein
LYIIVLPVCLFTSVNIKHYNLYAITRIICKKWIITQFYLCQWNIDSFLIPVTTTVTVFILIFYWRSIAHYDLCFGLKKLQPNEIRLMPTEEFLIIINNRVVFNTAIPVIVFFLFYFSRAETRNVRSWCHPYPYIVLCSKITWTCLGKYVQDIRFGCLMILWSPSYNRKSREKSVQ